MKIGVLTSSRADYSIYYPLLKELEKDAFFSVSVIAFGTHLSADHGYTLNKITEDGFKVVHTISAYPENDSPEAISRSIGNTINQFSEFWKREKFDLVFCLGDRYEMFAACVSATVFNVQLAHLHGGEQTLGAIDDAFRHGITHMSSVHFTAAEPYRKRVIDLKGSDKNVYNVGSLSIDNLRTLNLLSVSAFKEKFNIDLSIPTILITFHPETVSYEKNGFYVDELVAALEETKGYQFVITMPNADTMGNLIRSRLNKFIDANPNAIGVESFGTLGYLSCMKHCSFMLGNTSSGYIEAYFFLKYVIDLGERQTGRIVTENIQRCAIEKSAILKKIENVQPSSKTDEQEIYGTGDTARKITEILKRLK